MLALAAVAALRLPRNVLDRPVVRRQHNVRALFAVPGFLPLMALAALVLSSHALHDGFEVLRWQEGGIGPGTAGLLWSEGVLAEVVVFVDARDKGSRRSTAHPSILEPAWRCSECHRVGNGHDGCKRRSMRDTDKQEHREPGRKLSKPSQ